MIIKLEEKGANLVYDLPFGMDILSQPEIRVVTFCDFFRDLSLLTQCDDLHQIYLLFLVTLYTSTPENNCFIGTRKIMLSHNYICYNK